MPRLFVAVDLPSVVKDALPALRDDKLRGARWTKPEQWHITLHFIGETDAAPIHEALSRLQSSSFEMQLQGIGTFPPKGKPRILWAGVDAPDAMKTLYKRIGKALKTTGFTPEPRPYQAHLTLARFKQSIPSLEDKLAYLKQHRDFTSPRFTVSEFVLFESELQRSGAVYTIRQRYSLQTT